MRICGRTAGKGWRGRHLVVIVLVRGAVAVVALALAVVVIVTLVLVVVVAMVIVVVVVTLGLVVVVAVVVVVMMLVVVMVAVAVMVMLTVPAGPAALPFSPCRRCPDRLNRSDAGFRRCQAVLFSAAPAGLVHMVSFRTTSSHVVPLKFVNLPNPIPSILGLVDQVALILRGPVSVPSPIVICLDDF